MPSVKAPLNQSLLSVHPPQGAIKAPNNHHALFPSGQVLGGVAGSVNQAGESEERPRLVELSLVSVGHTDRLTSSRPEVMMVTVDETSPRRPPDTPSGT